VVVIRKLSVAGHAGLLLLGHLLVGLRGIVEFVVADEVFLTFGVVVLPFGELLGLQDLLEAVCGPLARHQHILYLVRAIEFGLTFENRRLLHFDLVLKFVHVLLVLERLAVFVEHHLLHVLVHTLFGLILFALLDHLVFLNVLVFEYIYMVG